MWGINGGGSLGQNNTTARSSPVQIPGTTWTDKISLGRKAAYAIKSDNTLWAWGANNGGVLGRNTPDNVHYSSPLQIPGTNWGQVRGAGATAV